MLFETVFIGSTIFALFKKNKKTQKKLKYLTEKNSLKTDISIEKSTEINHDSTHYFQLSIVATGIILVAPFLYPISFALLAYLCLPILRSTWLQWREQKQVGHDLLVSLLLISGFISNQLLALAIALFFYHLGKKLLAQTQKNAQAQLSNLFDQHIENVWIIHDQLERKVPLETVCKNDHIVVNTGDTIPIDGIIIEGMSLVDQQTLTGESQPVEKLPQDQVFAATQVISGRIVIKVEKTGTETAVAKISEILNHSVDYKISLLSKGEEQANKIALPLIALSTVTMPFLGVVGASGVLNSTFGNRLQLTAPLSVLNHLNLATQAGIMIKDGRVLETLLKVDTILFDKTGTLTEDQPTIGRIMICAKDYQVKQFLSETAAAEAKLAHPIAKAIVFKAQSEGLTLPIVEESDFHIGLGVSVKINNRIIRVGSLRFMEQHEIVIPMMIQAQVKIAYAAGHSVIFVAANDKLIGILEIEPTIRPEIKQMIQELRQFGIKQLVIVSGDHEETTKKLAQQLKMDHYFSGVMPEGKAKIVADLQKNGQTVCFIGDGINDAIAIKQADVSISLEGAATVAQDLAQIILMNGSLKSLSKLFEIAVSLDGNLNKTVKTLYAPMLINLSGALFFGFGLMTTVIINNTSLLLALRKTKQHSLQRKQIPKNL